MNVGLVVITKLMDCCSSSVGTTLAVIVTSCHIKTYHRSAAVEQWVKYLKLNIPSNSFDLIVSLAVMNPTHSTAISPPSSLIILYIVFLVVVQKYSPYCEVYYYYYSTTMYS